jgi:hypothetical protein
MGEMLNVEIARRLDEVAELLIPSRAPTRSASRRTARRPPTMAAGVAHPAR